MASYSQPHFYDSPSPVSDSSQPPESSRLRVPTRSRADKLNIAHPYARLYAKKDEVKRRRIWNHALEKSIFTPYELSTVGAPHRRTIYMASLEAYVDILHEQLLSLGFWPVAWDELDPFRGLNSKTAKSMVAGLQHDASLARLKLLELERANENLQNLLEPSEYM
ncbi:hypothetical protein BDN72DRAFT_830206 [Pluteus cervinus]|uniref:Uncharacterized protein n=1 Tax=Pluteus cervinus TaxID=181527 RepID=A0ACD3BFZ0_9AGAR|nr:hypothetical protein BDN72DRAFT_830206 [Pluteus cervinus]